MNRCLRSAGWLGVAIGGLCVLAGCGSPTTEPGTTPEATFQALKLAFQKKDFDALWGLAAESARDQWIGSLRKAQARLKDLRDQADKATGDAKQQALAQLTKQQQILEQQFALSTDEFARMAPKGLFVLICSRAVQHRPKILGDLGEATFQREEIKGDQATVFYTASERRDARVAMIKADGVWKIGTPPR